MFIQLKPLNKNEKRQQPIVNVESIVEVLCIPGNEKAKVEETVRIILSNGNSYTLLMTMDQFKKYLKVTSL